MKLINITFTQAVRVNGKMRDKVEEGEASAIGVVIATPSAAVLVPWHLVRYADIVERKAKRAKGDEP